MDKYTLGEVAYKNGYEKDFQDGVNKCIDRLTDVSFYSYFNQKWVISQEQIDNLSKELTEKGDAK